MKKFILIINLIYLVSFTESQAEESTPIRDSSYEFIITVPSQNISLTCTLGFPDKSIAFFDIFAGYKNHLFSFFSSKPLDLDSCENLAKECKKILDRNINITLEGRGIFKGHLEPVNEQSDRLLQEFEGQIYRSSFFSQISNGKTCACWLKECECLPVK